MKKGDNVFLLIQTVPTFWTERILILGVFTFWIVLIQYFTDFHMCLFLDFWISQFPRFLDSHLQDFWISLFPYYIQLQLAKKAFG